jgi:hypothetical protein
MRNDPSHVAFEGVDAETFILLTDTVTDLDDFVARPEAYLVSIEREPVRAAARWRERLRRNPHGGDGLVRLSTFGRDVFTAAQWDDVDGIWHELVELCHGYLATGHAAVTFPGQPLEITMRRAGQGAVLTAGEDRIPVDPAVFVPGVLDHAERFFTWVQDHVGLGRGDALARVEAARALIR